MDIAIGSTYRNEYGDKIRVLDICDSLDNKPKVVLYKKKQRQESPSVISRCADGNIKRKELIK